MPIGPTSLGRMLMRAIVVYESMFGNTHLIAEAIGDGMREMIEADVVSIHRVSTDMLKSASLLVVGGPTHMHGMSHASTRKSAGNELSKPDTDLTLDPEAAGDGVREWLDSLEPLTVHAAAFDTRIDASALISGRASKGISKHLRQLGCDIVSEPESFLVTKATRLEPDEAARAHAWGRALANKAIISTTP